ncbi:MAG: hypothetical protein JXQ29_04555 [Planctomycetes bacterium]|nr:hypothetical protein [Planctomycetota bacterium]
MKKTLKRLTVLQEIDARIHALRLRRDEIPRQIEEQVGALERAEARFRALEERARDVRRTLDSKTLELRALEEKTYQKEVQLNTLRTNESYRVMLREIAGLKADGSRIEDAILELSYGLDELGGTLAAARKDVDAARREHEQRQAELKERAGGLDREIEALAAERRARAAGIDAGTLALYDRILARRQSHALAAVRDQHCQGCQMKLTLHEMTQLLSCKELLSCRTCSRLLYLEEVVDSVGA